MFVGVRLVVNRFEVVTRVGGGSRPDIDGRQSGRRSLPGISGECEATAT
jgi:hypothetical protein